MIAATNSFLFFLPKWMATKMWSVRHILHVRGYKNPEPEMIERYFIIYFDIKEKMKELGSNPWDSANYQKKGANGNSMIELTDDAGMVNMLEELDAYKKISLNVNWGRATQTRSHGRRAWRAADLDVGRAASDLHRLSRSEEAALPSSAVRKIARKNH